MSPSRDPVRTARLVASPLAGEHFDELYALSSDARVMEAMRGAWSRRQTEANLAREIEHWRRHGFGLWAVRLRDGVPGEPRFVGRAGLRWMPVDGSEQVALSYAFHAEHWGKGFGTEISCAACDWAFGDLGFAEVVAYTLPAHHGSRRVMEKAGFEYEKEIVRYDRPHVLYRRRRSSVPSR